MKVKELNKRLEEIFSILGNDEIFGDMLENGEFENHNHRNDTYLNYECQLCYLCIPKGKVTINHLLNSYHDIKDFEKSFGEMLHDYLMGN